MIPRKSIWSAIALIALAAPVLAGSIYTWNYDYTQGGQNPWAGRIDAVQAVYDVDAQTISWNATFSAYAGRLPNGFTLAINDGANPKGHAGEMAMFYFDATGGTPILTAYAYNGSNALTSYYSPSPPDRIQSTLLDPGFASSLTAVNNPNGTRTLGFSINAAVINNHIPLRPGPGGIAEWSGAAYGDLIGTWFHPSVMASATYSGGYLTSWNRIGGGWLDLTNRHTVMTTTGGVVPEPETWLLLGLGVLGLAGAQWRRRRMPRPAAA